MQWLLNWLQTPTTIWEILRITFILFIIDMAWSLIFAAVIQCLHIETSQNAEPHDSENVSLRRYLLLHLPWIAVKEEFIFRFLPLALAVFFFGPSWPTVAVAVVSSMWFGLRHGNGYNILMQGVGGFLYCLIFLKGGGLNHHLLQAFLLCVVSHYLFNAILALIVVTLSNKPTKEE